MPVKVDHRPYLERQAPRILAIAYLGIAGCVLGGALAGGVLAYILTADKD